MDKSCSPKLQTKVEILQTPTPKLSQSTTPTTPKLSQSTLWQAFVPRSSNNSPLSSPGEVSPKTRLLKPIGSPHGDSHKMSEPDLETDEEIVLHENNIDMETNGVETNNTTPLHSPLQKPKETPKQTYPQIPVPPSIQTATREQLEAWVVRLMCENHFLKGKVSYMGECIEKLEKKNAAISKKNSGEVS